MQRKDFYDETLKFLEKEIDLVDEVCEEKRKKGLREYVNHRKVVKTYLMEIIKILRKLRNNEPNMFLIGEVECDKELFNTKKTERVDIYEILRRVFEKDIKRRPFFKRKNLKKIVKNIDELLKIMGKKVPLDAFQFERKMS